MTDQDQTLPFDPEKMTEPFVDDDYSLRNGYDENFLGICVPMPRVADTSVVAELNDGSGHVIPYEHFSVVLHKGRRLALMTASNVDANKASKEPEPGRDYTRRGLSGLGENDREKWVTDSRLDAAVQLPDKFYTEDRGNFDKGHIVRRDDVAWGDDYDEVRRANGDTYHVTNCSPQVDAFNRVNLRGEWGQLENFILRQAKVEKLCLFSGPVFDDENDRAFRGKDDQGDVVVKIPSLFWKVVVACEGNQLETFAFLLEQDLSDAEVEFNVCSGWQSRMISISDLEDLVPDLEFGAAIRNSDQFDKTAGSNVADAGGLERYVAASRPGLGSRRNQGGAMGNEQLHWNDKTSPGELETAFENANHATVGALLDALCDDLDKTGRLVDSKVAKKVLAALRKYAWFDKLELMAKKFDDCAQDDEQVLRQLAQARIELGEITTAVGGLLHLKQRLEASLDQIGLSALRKDTLEYELGEAMGLLGRAYKQYYVNAKPSEIEPRAHDLTKSLEYYGRAYDDRLGDYLWHGINYVALLTHKERIAQKRRNAISKDASRRAEEILDFIDAKTTRGEKLQSWDLANRIEANLAMGRTTEAIAATRAYLDDADAFNVQSTRRQLIEVWLLTEDKPPGDEILPMMNARFAELGGVPESIDLDPGQAAAYEKVWDKTKYKSLRWMNDALQRAKSVARIGPNKYDGDGTGFLFDGAWISAEWARQPLLLTNAHVCSNDPVVQAQYPYPSGHAELTAAFLGEGGASNALELKFKELVWSSAPSELDATLLLLESVPGACSPPPKTERQPPVTLKGDPRLNILGHPKGLDLRISLQDNKTVSVDDKYVHYRTPTDPGSSGSPVFDQNWNLVALHHAASSEKKANEGIRIDVIIAAMKKKLA